MLRFLACSRRWIASAAFALVTLLLGVVACDTTTSGGVPPTTGILIRAETLTTGRGCGRAPTQLFKYAVVVYGYSGAGDQADRASYTTPLRGTVFDCYVDGAFLELPAFGSNQTYRLEVYAYNEAAFTASAAAIGGAQTNIAVLRGTTPPPTWTTECTATQSAEVETLALCDPLSAGLAAFGQTPGKTEISLATQSFRLPDGRLAVCGPTPTTAEAGAGTDAGSDASVDADVDGGAPDGASDAGVGDAAAETDASAPAALVPFRTARVRARVGGTITAPPVDVTCPSPLLLEVAAEPAAYTLDVGLVDDRGAILGQTACLVTTQTGVVNTAACP